jgi:hypothetical protein
MEVSGAFDDGSVDLVWIDTIVIRAVHAGAQINQRTFDPGGLDHGNAPCNDERRCQDPTYVGNTRAMVDVSFLQ